MWFRLCRLSSWVVVFLLCSHAIFGEPIRIATYNLNNYLVMPRYVNGTWHNSYPKPESEKAIIRSVIQDAMPDILALQEVGALPFLEELKTDLAKAGIEYPYAIHMQGSDPVRHLAVLSKQAPIEVVSHQYLEINYQGKREFVKRGMLELTFEQEGEGIFKLFVVHLKSRRTDVKSDPKSQQRRTLEAEACRDRIIERTFEKGVAHFAIAGDFNDHPSSAPLRRLYQKGDQKIGTMVPSSDPRGDRWTHYYRKEVVYSLVDGFIVSEPLLQTIKDGRGHIVALPDVLKGSDHRMVYLDLLF